MMSDDEWWWVMIYVDDVVIIWWLMMIYGDYMVTILVINGENLVISSGDVKIAIEHGHI